MQLSSVLRQLSTRDKKIAILFIIYIILQIQGFSWSLGHEFLYFLIKFSIGTVIFLSLLNSQLQIGYKLAAVISYFALLYSVNQLQLWRISANAYLYRNQPVLTKAVTDLLKKKEDLSISKTTLIEGRKVNLSNSERKALLDLFNDTSVIEIEVSNGNVLFTFYRFIDNGYGFLYLGNADILKLTPPRVAYDLTSWTLLSENWYYVSFT